MPSGGSLKASVIKDMIKASYNNNEGYESIDGFTKNKQLSNSEVLCYYNSSTGQAVAVFRGTEGTATDWSNNAKYAVGMYDTTDRLTRAKEAYNKIINTYGEKNVSLVGHSQSAVITRKLGANAKEVINLNGANLGEKNLDNEHTIRSSSDVVSQVKPVADVYNKVQDSKWNMIKGAANYVLPKKQQFEMAKDTSNQNITIPSNSLNAISEHSPDIMDRLPADQMIGQGIHKNSIIQSIIFSRPKWSLGRSEKWLKKNKYKYTVDTKPNFYRFRQVDPQTLEHKGYHFVTQKIGDGIKAIIGILSPNRALPDYDVSHKTSVNNKRLAEIELQHKLSKLKEFEENKDKELINRINKIEDMERERLHRRAMRGRLQEPESESDEEEVIGGEGLTGYRKYKKYNQDSGSDVSDSDIEGNGIEHEQRIIAKLKKIRDSVQEHQYMHGGKIHIAKAFKDLGSTIKKGFTTGVSKEVESGLETAGKAAGHYITDKNGLEKDVINYGVPAVTGAIGGVAGEMLGGPLGGMAGSAMGAKAGDMVAQQIDKKAGVGRRGTGIRGRGRPRKIIMPDDLVLNDVHHSLMGSGMYDSLTLQDVQKMDALQKEHKLRSGHKDHQTKQHLKLELDRLKRETAGLSKVKISRKGIKGRGVMDLIKPKDMSAAVMKEPVARLQSEIKPIGMKKPRGMGFAKGSQAAKDHMARIRAMRKK